MPSKKCFSPFRIRVTDVRKRARRVACGVLNFAAGHFPEEAGDVVGRVLLRAAVAGGVDAGRPGQDLDFQACVVGKAVQAGFIINVLGFLQGIGPEGVARFGYIFGNAGIGRGDKLEPFSEDLARLAQLAGIAGGKNEFHSVRGF